MKKTLLALLGALLAQPVIAQDLEDEARDFTYEYEGQTLTYTVLDEDAKTCETKGGSIFSGGNYVSGNLIIPATAKDGDMEYSVTSIGMFAFSECSGLTTVTIPESVTSIGDYAFYWCSDLTSVEISNSVSSIGNNAFYQCSNLTSVSIGNSVSSIGVAAFYQCSNLTSVTIPGSVSSIANDAFENCSGLTSFKVEDGESSISFGENALASCPVEDLYLGRNWTYSGSGAISTGIKTLTIGDKVTVLPDNAFSGCSGLTSVVIGNAVTSIAGGTFSGCTGLTSFKVADGESEISFGENALASCPIEDLYLGRNWTYAGSGALSPGIKTLTIGDKVTALPDNAFSGCSGLTSVVIGNAVTSIAGGTFSGCTGLTSFKVADGESEISFGENALASCPIEDLYLGRNWTYSGSDALSTGIKALTLGDKVTALPSNAFSNCSGLTSVVIGNAVTSIGSNAFVCCSSLTSVEIPNSVTIIKRNAFAHCTALTSFKVEDGESRIRFEADALYSSPIEDLYLGRNWFYTYKTAPCPEIKTLTLGDKVTALPDYAFFGCTGLTSVEIPNSVTSIGASAFSGCSGLKSFKVADGESKISFGENALASCPIEDLYLGRNWTYSGSGALSTGIKTLTLGDKVTALPDNAFYDCSALTSVNIPNSVKSIGNYAFRDCSALISVNIPNSVISIGNYAFSGCSGLTSVEIPISVTSIGESTFLGCTSLTSVVIPNSVTSIGNYTFSGCSGLTSVEIPNSVTSIGASAFSECSGLTSVVIPNSITSIVPFTFHMCSGLTEVIIPPSVETIGFYAFAENTKLSSIIMGHNVKTIGDKAFDNCPAQTVYITAQTPPTVSDNTFSNYTGTLKVQGEAAKESYLSADYWKQFENSDLLNEPERFEIEGGANINGKPGDTIQLTATLYPGDVTLPQVFWRSTNPAVATVDHNGLVTIHADLSEIMAMAEGNEEETATQSCKIIAESLYANGPTAEFTIKEDIPTGVEEISADVIDSSLPVQVYTLQGMMVGDCVENLSAGIYIVRQGKNVKKIAVK